MELRSGERRRRAGLALLPRERLRGPGAAELQGNARVQLGRAAGDVHRRHPRRRPCQGLRAPPHLRHERPAGDRQVPLGADRAERLQRAGLPLGPDGRDGQRQRRRARDLRRDERLRPGQPADLRQRRRDRARVRREERAPEEYRHDARHGEDPGQHLRLAHERDPVEPARRERDDGEGGVVRLRRAGPADLCLDATGRPVRDDESARADPVLRLRQAGQPDRAARASAREPARPGRTR